MVLPCFFVLTDSQFTGFATFIYSYFSCEFIGPRPLHAIKGTIQRSDSV